MHDLNLCCSAVGHVMVTVVKPCTQEISLQCAFRVILQCMEAINGKRQRVGKLDWSLQLEATDCWLQLAGKLYMEAIEAVEDDGKEGLSGDMYRQAIGALLPFSYLQTVTCWHALCSPAAPR